MLTDCPARVPHTRGPQPYGRGLAFRRRGMEEKCPRRTCSVDLFSPIASYFVTECSSLLLLVDGPQVEGVRSPPKGMMLPQTLQGLILSLFFSPLSPRMPRGFADLALS